MKIEMNVGYLAGGNPTDGIGFDAKILNDDSVAFHYSLTAQMSQDKKSFDFCNEFADYGCIIKAVGSQEIGARLYKAFRVAVYDMMIGIVDGRISESHYTVVTLSDDCLMLELKELAA